MDMLEDLNIQVLSMNVCDASDRVYVIHEGDANQRHDGASFFKSADYS